MRAWSPELAQAGVEKRSWKTRIANALAGIDDQLTLCKTSQKHNIRDDQTQDISELEARYDLAAERFKVTALKATVIRHNNLDNSIRSLELRHGKGSKEQLRAIKAIKSSEHQTQMFRKIRQTFRQVTGGSVSRVDVPSDLALEVEKFTKANLQGPINTKASAHLKNILQRTIRTKRSHDTTEEWETIIEKDKLETAILMYCHQHFQQASEAPFGIGVLAEAIGSDGLTELSNRILQGIGSDNELFPEIGIFIKELTMPDIIKLQEPK
jgi:hypothetical protein